jgi:hypothetical protein
MTDYCTLDDVYPLIAAIGELTEDTQLNLVAAEVLITQVSAEIDGHLRAKSYALPVEDDEAIATLLAICMSGSAARILRSLFPAATGVSGDAGAAAAHEKVYADGLALIDKGGLSADMVSGGMSFAHGFNLDRSEDQWQAPY